MTAHRAKSERGIKALPDGKFEYTIRFRGKLERKVFPTKGICKAQREKRKVELREGHYGPPKAPTFEAVVEKFLEWSEASVRPKTHTWDKWISGVWLASPAFAGKKLDQITPSDIEDFKKEQRARTRPARLKEGENAPPVKVSPRLVDACLARLRRLFSLSVSTWGYLRENPAAKVPLIHEDPGRLRYLDAKEEKKLLAACSPRLALLVRFAILTGMRRMEVLKLCPAEVDLSAKVARVEGTRTKNRVPRVVPLSKEAVSILKQLPKPKDPKAAYFGTRLGTLDQKLYRAFGEAVEKARIHDFTFHDLRHTFASRLVAAGVNLITVQHLLGHASITMTMRYAHLAPGQEAEAVERLSQGQSIRKSIRPLSGPSKKKR